MERVGWLAKAAGPRVLAFFAFMWRAPDPPPPPSLTQYQPHPTDEDGSSTEHPLDAILLEEGLTFETASAQIEDYFRSCRSESVLGVLDGSPPPKGSKKRARGGQMALKAPSSSSSASSAANVLKWPQVRRRLARSTRDHRLLRHAVS